MGGKVDALVFAGGIGEKSAELREAVTERVECLGFAIDPKANREVEGTEGAVVDIGKHSEGRRVLVCRTDEQVSIQTALVSNDADVYYHSMRWQRSAP